MANPFLTKFKSSCQSCGVQVPAGDQMYCVERMFVCGKCAEENGNVCRCGGFKKEGFAKCFTCNTMPAQDETPEWDAWSLGKEE